MDTAPVEPATPIAQPAPAAQPAAADGPNPPMASVPATRNDTPAGVETLSAAWNQFGFDLYGQLNTRAGNLFFSPYSIATALTMTYAGARAETASQMATTLRLPRGEVHAVTQELAASLVPASEDYELRIANRLWAHETLTLHGDFAATMRDHYAAEVGLLDFAATEAAREQINAWVADQTQQRILNLIPPRAITALTRLVLTNAIYFKGTWTHQFDTAQTQPGPFYGATAQGQVPFMYQEGSFEYAQSANWQALRLPYVSNALSMLLLLPAERGALARLEPEVHWADLETLIAQLQPMRVAVWLPRFEATSQFTLNAVLRDLGMPDAFDPALADFSGMSNTELYISKVIHKAFVEVNEEGSEAAAATAVIMTRESVIETVEFRADHPFIYMIVDNNHNTVLFMGRLSEAP